MKKLFALAIALVMALSMVAAIAEDTQTLELGTSGLAVTVPAGYAAGEISAEDTDENQVGYYKSEASLVDFDVYQWAKADEETLEAAAAAEAAEYEATAVAAEINGITVWSYTATEESDGAEYTTVTYMMENGDFFAEIVFWLDGETAADEVNAIISTLTVTGEGKIDEGGTEIVLGTSHLKITTAVPYVLGELSEEDTDENQVAYYTSEESLIDFDVYQWAKAEGETAESAAAEEAAEYESEIAEIIVNDIVAYGYYAEEEYDGKTYETFTVIAEDGSDFVEIVFWLDGENDPELEMTNILSTLVRF